MYCSGCGQAMVAGQGFCPRCGLASGMGMPPNPGRNVPGVLLPMAQVERRVNALAVGWMIYAGLVAVTGFVGLVFAHAWLGGHMGGLGHWGDHGMGLDHRMGHFPFMPLFLMKFAIPVLATRVLLALAAGIGLMQKTSWGRWVAIVAGCLALFHPLLGTALGIWTLVVLLSSPNAAGYEVMASR